MANPQYGQNKVDNSLSKLSGGALSGSATWDATSIGDGDEQAVTIAVSGARLGDFALASITVDLTDMVLNANVTAADQVSVVLANNTGSGVDLASATASVLVIKKV